MNTVYLDGQYIAASEAKVSVFDRGFLFGDSVYEVIPFYRGVGFGLSAHLERLAYSLDALDISVDLNWERVLHELVQRNGGGNLSVYLQITRGSAGKRAHAIDKSLKPTVFACCQPIKDIYEEGAESVQPIKVIVTEDLRWSRCDIKSTGLLANIIVLQKASKAGAQEALLEKNGLLTEGASCNFFIVEKGVIVTPPKSHNILTGTTRELIVELAADNAIPLIEGEIDYSRLISADEVWISSSTRAIVPVTQVDEHPIGQGVKGEMWARVFALFIRYQHQLMTGE